jgi:nucleoside-diphosphate-sugar epimerase
MKTVVFGATGFIGSYVAEQLKLAGHEVAAVVRPGGDTRLLDRWGVPAVVSDFASAENLARSLAGAEVVYNCTANPRFHRASSEWGDVEVVLTRRIAEAAARAGARRFVQLSTVKVYGWRMPAQPVDETFPCRPEFPYERQFLEREQAVQAVAAATGLETVLLRPSGAFGARYRFFARLAAEHRRGTFSVIGDGSVRSSYIDARDIGRAMVWLGEYASAAGQTYVVRGFEASWLDLKAQLDAATGHVAKLRSLPVPLAYAIGAALEWFTPTSRDPALTRLIVRYASSPALLDDRKLRATGFATRFNMADSVVDHVQELERGNTAHNPLGR